MDFRRSTPTVSAVSSHSGFKVASLLKSFDSAFFETLTIDDGLRPLPDGDECLHVPFHEEVAQTLASDGEGSSSLRLPSSTPGLPLRREPQALDAPHEMSTEMGKNWYRHGKRQVRRIEKRLKEGYTPSLASTKKVVEASTPIATDMKLATLRAAHGGYGGIRVTEGLSELRREWTAKELIREFGMSLVRWDGRTATPLCDSDGRVYACLSGRPNDASYEAAASSALIHMLGEGSSVRFTGSSLVHHRGRYPALNAGISYGGGQSHPLPLRTEPYTQIVEQFLQDPSIQRMASYASSAFRRWAPRVFNYYQEHLNKLPERLPDYRPIFERSVYPCAAFNLGGNVRTYKHRDILNCPFGWCSITALGNFDSREGGHIVLWEPKQIIEFPHAATLLIPSAIITHSNTSTAAGETRLSFTQYCPGGLFRWIDNGGKTEDQLNRENPMEYQRMQSLKGSRWKEGLSLLSTAEELNISWRATGG